VSKLDVTDARVRKCKNVSILIDKKMRERRIEHDKYIIMLDENNPFGKDESVKIISKDDFEKLGKMLKSVKSERDNLKDQVRNLETLLEVQKKFIDKIEKVETRKEDNSGSKGIFRNLF
jgi:hypothetical protein